MQADLQTYIYSNHVATSKLSTGFGVIKNQNVAFIAVKSQPVQSLFTFYR